MELVRDGESDSSGMIG